MALLDFQQQILGRNKIWGATVGSSDLPTTGLPGDWTIGDIVMNLNGAAIGAETQWVCVGVTTAGNPTFGSVDIARGTTLGKTITPPYTLANTDNIIVSPAGAITLPTTFPAYNIYYIHATASSVTLTPTSGQINGAAASTLAANANLQIFVDSTGTNWYSVN